MALTVKLDILEGSRAEERNGVIWEVTRVACVTGLTGNSSTILDVLNSPGLPPPFEAHPNYPTLILFERKPRAVSDTVAFVDLIYKHPTFIWPTPMQGARSGGVGLSQITDVADRHGNAAWVEYNDDRKGAEFTALLPQATAAFDLVQSTPGGYEYPGLLARDYVGKLNSEPWNGGAIGEWLCTAINYMELGGAPTQWAMHYEFQAKPGGWQPLVQYFLDDGSVPEPDEPGGPPPPGSRRTVDWYAEADFNALGLF